MVSLAPVKITRVRNFTQYKKFTNPQKFSQIKKLAKKLAKVKITVISATPYGGGVAEIWHSAIPIFQSLGMDFAWYSIVAPKEFFDVTKKFHNLLQGAVGKLTEAEQKLYLSVNKKLARDLSQIPTDILLVHDPQPAAIVQFLPNPKPLSCWRCHIDTSTTNRTAWDFLKQFLNSYDHLIFTLPQYVHNEIVNYNNETNEVYKTKKPNGKTFGNVSIFCPTIDPFDEKLAKIPKNEAFKILSQFGISKTKHLIFAPSRFDPFKDPQGIFEMFLLVKKHVPSSQLLFTGPLAFDDPESVKLRKKLLKKIKRTEGVKIGRDVFVYTNLDGFSYRELAAAYSAADVVVQKSLAEGFGLTVTEASYHGKPVIGSAVGGIAFQIIDYYQNPDKATGILVDITSEDRGVADAAFWCEMLIKDHKLGKILGKNARRRVIKNFLHPVAVFNYLNLFNNLFHLKLKRGKFGAFEEQSYYY